MIIESTICPRFLFHNYLEFSTRDSRKCRVTWEKTSGTHCRKLVLVRICVVQGTVLPRDLFIQRDPRKPGLNSRLTGDFVQQKELAQITE